MGDSVWLGLFPKPEEAEKIAVREGIRPEKLHITLKYITKKVTKDTLTADQLEALIADHITWYNGTLPTEGEVTGYGRFLNPNVVFAIPSVEGLGRFVANLPIYSKSLEFIPHMSLIFDPLAFTRLPYKKMPLTFEGVTVVYKDTKILVPFSANLNTLENSFRMNG